MFSMCVCVDVWASTLAGERAGARTASQYRDEIFRVRVSRYGVLLRRRPGVRVGVYDDVLLLLGEVALVSGLTTSVS